MKYPHLFKEGKIGSLTLKNRLIMAPMVRNYAGKNGEVTDRYRSHIDSIASGGTGMLVLEASYISPEGKGFINQLGIHDDKLMTGLSDLVKIAHKYNAKIGPQLYHAGRQTHHDISGHQPVAPSPVACPVMQDKPKELTIEEIITIENLFASSAYRAKEIGFDFIEIHGAHGYLINQFLSPFSNQRKDKYGGTFENRMRFLINIILKTRAILGDSFPITVRLSADEMVTGGITIKDSTKIAQTLEKLSINGLHISAGNYATYNLGYMIPPMATDEAPLLKYVSKIKKSVTIPVIAVAKIHRPALANQIIKENKADFIGLGRALLADPNWTNKCQSEQVDSINHCITCNQGCISRLFAQQDVRCTVNPLCGFEKELALKPTKKPKKIVIVGGGPTGLYSAIQLDRIGHKVTLIEKSRKLGGQLNLAEIPPYRNGITELKEYLIRTILNSKVKIITAKNYDADSILKLKPEIILNATGSQALRPPIDGIDFPNVILSEDILTKKLKLKKKIIIAGGGCQGAQIADLLSSQKKQVTIIELGIGIANEMPGEEKQLLLARLEKNKVKIHTEAKILKIDPDGVIIEKKKGKTKIKSDHVVICFGRKPNQELYKELKKQFKKVYNIGDSHQVGRITECLFESATTLVDLT